MSDFFQFQDFECEGNKWLASNHVKKATRPAKTRVAFLFSLVVPIYVGKQCNQESPALLHAA